MRQIEIRGAKQADIYGTYVDDPSATIKLYHNRQLALSESSKRVSAILPVLLTFAPIWFVVRLFLIPVLGVDLVEFALLLTLTGALLFLSSVVQSRSRISDIPTFEISEEGLKIDLGPILGSFRLIEWQHISRLELVSFCGRKWIAIYAHPRQLYSKASSISSLLLVGASTPFWFLWKPRIEVPANLFALPGEEIVELMSQRHALALCEKNNGK